MASQHLRLNNAAMSADLQFDARLLRKYDVRGPRYTSYPTAPQFTPAFDESAWRQVARECGSRPGPLSLYVHVPFCRTVCFYCGCNKVITANYTRAEKYLGDLEREMHLQGAYFSAQEVRQLHFGGGTPTYLSAEDLVRVFEQLHAHFRLSRSPEREYSIEVDPRTVNADTIALLEELGFNRLSLGVQDFDPAVQRAINRVQSVEQTADVLHAARAHGFTSTNLDLIYGLPRQTEASFHRTLDTVLALEPERLAVYAYAHLPELFKVQRNIDPDELPDANLRLRLLELSIERLTAAGYVYIGMDHFARPEDELAKAQIAGTLHRNFQGYSTHAQCDLVALGVSAISDLGAAYAQNARDLATYAQRLEEGRSPVVHGVRLTNDDLLRRDVIQSLMCQGRIDVAAIEARHRVSFLETFAVEMQRLEPLEGDGLVERNAAGLRVTPRGRLLLRNVAMVFDAYLQRASAPRYSKAI